jgi:O-antigen/teichoic acid export membrane protein
MLATAVLAYVLATPLWPSKAWKAVGSAFRLGLPVLPHSLAIMLLMQGDTFLVQHFQGSQAAGRYVAAAAFALGPFAILSALNNVWTPRIFEASHGEHFVDTARRVGNQTALVGAAVAVGASAAATLGMLVLKGPDHEVTQLAKVLPAVACGYSLYLVAMSLMFARQKTGAFTWVTPLLLVAGAGLAGNFAESDQFWLLGAVKATAFAGLGAAYCVLAVRMLPGAIPLGSFALAAAVSTAAIASNLLFPTTPSAGVATVAVVGLTAGAAFLVMRKRVLASW